MFFINEKENAKTKSSENWTNWTGLFSFVKFLTLFGSNLSNFGGSIGTECWFGEHIDQLTEVRFASFLFGGFIIAIVIVNPPVRKRTSVQLFVRWFKDSHVRKLQTHMPLVYSIIHARLETIFTTMSCFTFVPTCKNGWHIVQLLGKKMAIAENAKQTTLKWLAMACTLSKVFQTIKSLR